MVVFESDPHSETSYLTGRRAVSGTIGAREASYTLRRLKMAQTVALSPRFVPFQTVQSIFGERRVFFRFCAASGDKHLAIMRWDGQLPALAVERRGKNTGFEASAPPFADARRHEQKSERKMKRSSCLLRVLVVAFCLGIPLSAVRGDYLHGRRRTRPEHLDQFHNWPGRKYGRRHAHG